MSPINLTNKSFNEIRDSEKPVLIDFYADWCGPCRMMSPIIDEIAEEREDVVVCKVNVDNEPSLAQEFEVYSIPTLVVMRGGEVVKRSAGARPKAAVLALLDE